MSKLTIKKRLGKLDIRTIITAGYRIVRVRKKGEDKAKNYPVKIAKSP